MLPLLLIHIVFLHNSHYHEQAKSTHPDSDSEYISKSEVINLLKKLESSIGVSVNVRLLSLEE